jgi:hypothetical protein
VFFFAFFVYVYVFLLVLFVLPPSDKSFGLIIIIIIIIIIKPVCAYESTLSYLLLFGFIRLEERKGIDSLNTTNQSILINKVVVRSEGCRCFHKAVKIVL